MERVRLGAGGPWVSRLLFGTLTMGPLQRGMDVDAGAALIVYAARRGVTCVDTAEYYETYPYIRAAREVFPDLMVITKSYAYDADGAKRSLEKAQEGIGRERIDAFLLHEQESEHTLRGHAEAFETYKRFQQDGVIGAVGISTHHVAAVRAAAGVPGMDVVFPILNRTGLGVADGTRREMEAAARQAHDRGIGVLAMKALGGGHLIADRDAALSYVLELSYVDCVALGMQSEAEIDYNIARVEGRRPGAEAARQSAGAPRRLIVQEWCEGCGRCVKRCGLSALSLYDGKACVDSLRCVCCGYCAGVCPQFCLKII